MKRILLAGFCGRDNSAKLLLDHCSDTLDKLYLENDFSACAAQIQLAVRDAYDFILILGQKPVVKSIYIEACASYMDAPMKTTFDFAPLANRLTASGFQVRISQNAGNYLCNHVYAHGLAAAAAAGRPELLLLHVPWLKNLPALVPLASLLSDFLLNLQKGCDTHDDRSAFPAFRCPDSVQR